jgi:hypothetical protein
MNRSCMRFDLLIGRACSRNSDWERGQPINALRAHQAGALGRAHPLRWFLRISMRVMLSSVGKSPLQDWFKRDLVRVALVVVARPGSLRSESRSRSRTSESRFGSAL